MADLPPLYRSYDRWKGWNNPFEITRDEHAYFGGEFRGIPLNDTTVFEIGFGSGKFLAWAQLNGARVAGCEINPLSLAAARDQGIELVPADFESVAHEHTGRFDTVVAFDVFEHFSLDEIRQRLHALEMMMKPDSHLVLRFPNSQSPFGLAPQNGDPTHVSALSRQAFGLLVQGMDFEIIRYSGSYRIGGGGIARRVIRFARRGLQGLISAVLKFTYASDIPYDPVVVLVMRLRPRPRIQP